MLLNTTQRESAVEDILDELKAAGLKATRQRRAIVCELVGDLTHPTAQGLFERLQPSFPTMSFATVYNTLSALASVHAVRPMSLGGATRFDPNTDPHHHAVCDSCDSVRDVPIGRAPRRPTLPDFEVERIEYIYRGICAVCAKGRGDATQ